MPPSRSLPPVECCRGTSPIHAAKSRPDLKPLGSATVEAMAGPDHAYPGYGFEAAAHIIGTMMRVKRAFCPPSGVKVIYITEKPPEVV
jgi:hypothetical protein